MQIWIQQLDSNLSINIVNYKISPQSHSVTPPETSSCISRGSWHPRLGPPTVDPGDSVAPLHPRSHTGPGEARQRLRKGNRGVRDELAGKKGDLPPWQGLQGYKYSPLHLPCPALPPPPPHTLASKQNSMTYFLPAFITSNTTCSLRYIYFGVRRAPGLAATVSPVATPAGSAGPCLACFPHFHFPSPSPFSLTGVEGGREERP